MSDADLRTARRHAAEQALADRFRKSRQRRDVRTMPDAETLKYEDAVRLMAKCSTTLGFAETFWPVVEPARAFVPGWHLGCIGEHLDDVSNPYSGSMQNLIINLPPRCMKSLQVCVFWFCKTWTVLPGSRWMFASFSQDLISRDSDKCRDIIRHPLYQRLWDVRIKAAHDTRLRFGNYQQGFRHCVTTRGGGGMGEGADFLCHPAGTMITTAAGPVPVERLAVGDTVLALDHATGKACWRPVTHRFRRIGEGADSNLYGRRDRLYRIRTRAGRVLTLTGNHPVYVEGRGYVPAEELTAGDGVTVHADLDVRSLREGVRNQNTAVEAEAAPLPLLRDRLPGEVERDRRESVEPGPGVGVRRLRQFLPLAVAVRRASGVDVFAEVPVSATSRIAKPADRSAVYELREVAGPTAVSRSGRQEGMLFQEVCRHPSSGSDPRPEERPVQVRSIDRPVSGRILGVAEAACSPAGRRVCRLPDDFGGPFESSRRGTERASRRFRHHEQRDGESGCCVQGVSREDARFAGESRRLDRPAPEVSGDVVESVTYLGDRGDVFSIEVGEHHNYFADGVLVHNCIDDPQNPKLAASALERENTIRWYRSTFSRRGNDERTVRKVVIMQRLNDRDLTGFLLAEQMGWHHLCLPMRYEPRRYFLPDPVIALLADPVIPVGTDPDEPPAAPPLTEAELKEAVEVTAVRSAAVAAGLIAGETISAGVSGAARPRDAIIPTPLQLARPHLIDGPGGSGRTEEGDLLWPERFGEKEVNRAEDELGPDAPGQYGQRPTGESGDIFTVENIRRFESIWTVEDTPEDGTLGRQVFGGVRLFGPLDGQERVFRADQLTFFQTVDTAATEGKRSAYTAVLTFGVTPEFDVILWHVFRARLNAQYQYGMVKAVKAGPVVWLAKARRLLDAGRWPFPIAAQAVEPKSTGIQLIQEAAADGNPLHPLKVDGDKVMRAAPVSRMYLRGKVYHPRPGPKWLADAENELVTFPHGNFKDVVDCIAYAGQLVIHDKIIRAMCTSRVMAEVYPDDDGPPDTVTTVNVHGEPVDVDWGDDDRGGLAGFGDLFRGFFNGR